MTVIGLCGGSGSGKGLVCNIFNEFGIKSIDTDRLYHELISSESECTKELISCFGDGIASSTGINRVRLREVAFSSKSNLTLINKITHKHILEVARKRIDQYKRDGYKGVVIDAPLLFESGFDKECDLTVCVIADEELRINRIIKRDGISRNDAVKRINSQIPNDKLIKKCTYCIENNSTEEILRLQVAGLINLIFEK